MAEVVNTPKISAAFSHQNNTQELSLDDDGMSKSPEFQGVTLEIDHGQSDQPSVEFSGREVGPAQQGADPHPVHDSKLQRSSSIRESDIKAEDYFCTKKGAFESAVEACKSTVADKNLDGEVTAAWLLTEIDHWDHEREKLILLTRNSVLVVKYDFITQNNKGFRRLFLHDITNVRIGQISYPNNSVMTNRDYAGVRVQWGDSDKVTWGQKWNPMSSNIPYTTFAHHKLIYNEEERETTSYSVDDFHVALVQAVENNAREKSRPAGSFVSDNGPVVIESYASISSLVFNQSHLGYNRDRNGISF